MNVAVSKWGNSIGIRIPIIASESLGLRAGDQINLELKDGGMFFKKEKTTKQMFEDFYGKKFDTLSVEDFGETSELDWGNEMGGEKL